MKITFFMSGIFYKLSNLLFDNNFLFFLTGFLGLILSWLFYKIDKNIFYIIHKLILWQLGILPHKNILNQFF